MGDEFPRRLCDPLYPVILFYHVSLQPTSGNIKQQSQGVGSLCGPGGGGTPYNGLYGEVPPERGTFFRLQVYKRVGISQV